jgi:hypothetical protein
LFHDNRGSVFTFHEELGTPSWLDLRAATVLSLGMSVLSQRAIRVMRGAVFAMALAFSTSGTSYAQRVAPFDRLVGQWSGSGAIELSNGTHESIRCRAAYDVLREQSKLQLNIRCASEGANFDLRASADYSAGAITGYWSESSRGVSGTISGRAEGDRFQVVARAASFVATLTLVTHGGRQSVVIRSQDAQSSIKAVSVNLRRSS